MTDLPYTDDDLRAEAARQHATLTEDPDFMGVGEMLDGRYVHYEFDETIGCLMPTPGTPRWDELPEETFEAGQREIHDLIDGAADVSEWAINLGADGLEPDARTVEITEGTHIGVRIHFAFDPDLPEAIRQQVVDTLREDIYIASL